MLVRGGFGGRILERCGNLARSLRVGRGQVALASETRSAVRAGPPLPLPGFRQIRVSPIFEGNRTFSMADDDDTQHARMRGVCVFWRDHWRCPQNPCDAMERRRVRRRRGEHAGKGGKDGKDARLIRALPVRNLSNALPFEARLGS